MEFKRITIFAGNYGSGKTEISINFVQKIARYKKNVILVDLDVVNPYFRSREKCHMLTDKGIEVIFPKNLAKADLPIISANIKKLLQNDSIYGVMDIGGNENGAISLASISPQIANQDYEMCLVVNTLRPYTSNLSGIIKMKEEIENTARLKFTKLVCNTNVANETKIGDVKKGYLLVKKASKELNLPIKFISINKKLLPLTSDFQPEDEILPISIYMNPPWVVK